jgi:hypothetical protein
MGLQVLVECIPIPGSIQGILRLREVMQVLSGIEGARQGRILG